MNESFRVLSPGRAQCAFALLENALGALATERTLRDWVMESEDEIPDD